MVGTVVGVEAPLLLADMVREEMVDLAAVVVGMEEDLGVETEEASAEETVEDSWA